MAKKLARKAARRPLKWKAARVGKPAKGAAK